MGLLIVHCPVDDPVSCVPIRARSSAILADTSAWVHYLRATGSDDTLHTTDVVVMEVLAGGWDEAHVGVLRRLLSRCEFVPVDGLADFEQAAALFRRCRIAAVAVRAGLDVLHADRDFDALARRTALQLHAPPLSNPKHERSPT